MNMLKLGSSYELLTLQSLELRYGCDVIRIQ